MVQGEPENGAELQLEKLPETSSGLEAALFRPLAFGEEKTRQILLALIENRCASLRCAGCLAITRILKKSLHKILILAKIWLKILTIWPFGRLRPHARPAVMFRGHRYAWRFPSLDEEKWFELRGFFTVQGNVVILETFATNPKELENLPFRWNSFRSILLMYQEGQFVAVSAAGEQIKIY